MKKIKNILPLSIIAVVCVLGSCKQFLDRKPLRATLDDLHQGTLESQSFGLYSALRSSAGFFNTSMVRFSQHT